MFIDTGKWSTDELNRLLREASGIKIPGEKTGYISKRFLGTPYRADTLSGSPDKEERLVINLSALDCFTFLDYVEAMRRVDDFQNLPEALRKVRYRSGSVSYTERNHFFILWGRNNSPHLLELFTMESLEGLLETEKTLNLRQDGSPYLEGIEPEKVRFRYLSLRHLKAVHDILATGDYIGFYSPSAGLDVTHTGIVIRKGEKLLLRHASSRPGVMRVIDEDLYEYALKHEGIILFRPVL
jgi:hypothetical protein